MRRKKNRLFDLFKHDFTITAFYKSADITKEPYYLILDGVVQIRIWYIHGVLVLDEVAALSKAYLKAIYDKIVEVLMKQTEFTVLISLMTSSNLLAPSCIRLELPVVTDDRYLTIPKSYYDALSAKVTSDPNLGITLGFYLVAVSDSTDTPVVGRANQLTQLTLILQKDFPNIRTTTSSESALEVSLTSEQGVSEFEITIAEGKILLKDIRNTTMANLGFVQMTKLISCIENFLNVTNEVYLVNVSAVEVKRICEARGYLHLNEASTLTHSNLFKHIHCNYGTYRVIIK